MIGLSAGRVAAILEPLHRHQVDCILVGGAAAWAHRASQRPSDIDVVLRLDWDNAERAASALHDLHARVSDDNHSMTDADRAHLSAVRLDAVVVVAGTTLWQTDHGQLDLFDTILGQRGHTLYYEHLLDSSAERRVAGIPIRLASIEAVIESKAAADRFKDLAVVAALQRIATRWKSPRGLSGRALPVPRPRAIAGLDVRFRQDSKPWRCSD